MEIVAALPDDAVAVAQIHVAAWRAAYAEIISSDFLARQSVERRQSSWTDAIAAGRPELLVARRGIRVLGWIAFGDCRDDDAPVSQGEVWAMYVAPEFWSQGVGRSLWHAAHARLRARGFRSVSLWVLAENYRAIKFYIACGLHPDASSEKKITMGEQLLTEVRYISAIDE